METNSEPLSNAEKANHNSIQEDRELKKAKEAVEQLGVVKFINTNKALIYRKLEDCEICVLKAQKNMLSGDSCTEGSECDTMFIADSLPIVTGIVNVGSETLNGAKEWVRDLVPDADPIALLSALTLLYLVENGRKEYEGDNSKMIKNAKDLGENVVTRKEVWRRIYDRVKHRLGVHTDLHSKP